MGEEPAYLVSTLPAWEPREVVCLEPGAEGSSSGVLEKFKKLHLGLKDKCQVKLVSTKLQNFDPNDKKFDIILLHNSINHMDEKACINLKYDSQALEIYRMIFQKLSNLASNGAKLIVCHEGQRSGRWESDPSNSLFS